MPWTEIGANIPVVANLLAGSLVGAYVGAGLALRLDRAALHRVIAILLVAIALVLLLGHGFTCGEPLLAGIGLITAGLVAGFGIGVVASLLGVAGGELLIPTLVLLFGIDVKLAGSLSLVISLPTMLVGFARYARDDSFAVIGRNRTFVAIMALGSIAGASIGSRLLGIVPDTILLPALAAILMISAYKMWRH